MDIIELGNAAMLAEDLSRYRHKKIRLIVTPRGITVDGRLIRPDGVEMQWATQERDWAAITEAAVLEGAIRHVDRTLTAEWTSMEPADDH